MNDTGLAGERRVAYFSMEIGLEEVIPTYSGGLGILAGDTIRSAADMRIPMAAVTLLHRKGYFFQRLDDGGRQHEEPVEWVVDDYLEEMNERAAVTIEGREVILRAWKKDVAGIDGAIIPVYFIDSDLPENAEFDRSLSHVLYGGDSYYRICQEIILGIGGVRMLNALGYAAIKKFHMNEGHAAFLTLELLKDEAARQGMDILAPEVVGAVTETCVFTTHTPVAAGHDKFPMDLVRRAFGQEDTEVLRKIVESDDTLNMTRLALSLSHYINGVAKKHGEVSRYMFSSYEIDSITNGVHAGTWASPPFQELFDRYIPGWRKDFFSLRYAVSIPKREIWDAHMTAKKKLLQLVNRSTNTGMDIDHLTIAFARRAAVYKRGDLLFQDLERLENIGENAGPIQIIYAGKAHPKDQEGKELIRRVFEARERLKEKIRVVYLENYDINLAKLLVSGVDIWLNTPIPPFEASGTSGMKAAMNGVPSLSVLDGWWIEGCIEGETGWAIGPRPEDRHDEEDLWKDAGSLYDKLEHVVIPLYYGDRERFIDVMAHAISLNGSFFNTQRMIQQYVVKAYYL